MATYKEWIGMLNRSYPELEWLSQLGASVQTVVDFGCGNTSQEPLALLWYLDAEKIVIVEKESKHLYCLKKTIEDFVNNRPESLAGRHIKFLAPADMTVDNPELPSDYFDLAYCARVLYQIRDTSPAGVDKAIRQMLRVVKPNGWIVIEESEVENLWARLRDIDELELCLQWPDNYQYCYRKLATDSPISPMV